MSRVSGRGIGNTICDVCGFQFKTNELRKRWDGFLVCDDDFETRHPQELIRVHGKDPTPLPNARRPIEIIIGPPNFAIANVAVASMAVAGKDG